MHEKAYLPGPGGGDSGRVDWNAPGILHIMILFLNSNSLYQGNALENLQNAF